MRKLKKKNACSKCFLCKHTKQAVRESTLPGKWVLLIWLLFRLKSYSTLCDPWTIACQTPLSVENQARILEWVATSFSRIFLDQGSNLRLLHWQADSLPLSHHREATIRHCEKCKTRDNKKISGCLPTGDGERGKEG